MSFGLPLCDRWLQVAVTLCCHLSLKSLGRKEPTVRFPLHLPVVPLHLWLIQMLLLTRYRPLGIPYLGSPEGCRTPFSLDCGYESETLRNTLLGVTVAQAVIVMWDHYWLYTSSPLQGSWQWDERELGHRNYSWLRLYGSGTWQASVVEYCILPENETCLSPLYSNPILGLF